MGYTKKNLFQPIYLLHLVYFLEFDYQGKVASLIPKDKSIQHKFTPGKVTKGEITQMVTSFTLFCLDCSFVIIYTHLVKTLSSKSGRCNFLDIFHICVCVDVVCTNAVCNEAVSPGGTESHESSRPDCTAELPRPGSYMQDFCHE